MRIFLGTISKKTLHQENVLYFSNILLPIISIYCIVSGIHDVGYCIDLNRHILSHTAFLKSSPGIRHFQENLQKNYTELEKALIVSLNLVCHRFFVSPMPRAAMKSI